jgi:hypothetical protein
MKTGQQTVRIVTDASMHNAPQIPDMPWKQLCHPDGKELAVSG